MFNLHFYRIDTQQFSHLLWNLIFVYLHEGVGNECHTGLKFIKMIEPVLKLLPKLGQEVTIPKHQFCTCMVTNIYTTEGKYCSCKALTTYHMFFVLCKCRCRWFSFSFTQPSDICVVEITILSRQFLKKQFEACVVWLLLEWSWSS